MTTGYTARLESLEFNVQRWLKEDLIRAMGVCIMLRDESQDLTQEQIQGKLKDSGSFYHKDHIKIEELDLESKLGFSDSQWEEIYDSTMKEEFARFQESELAKLEKRGKYEKSLTQIKLLKGKLHTTEDEDELIKNTLDLAESQIISTIDWDCKSQEEDYKPSSQTWQKFRDLRIEVAKESIDYHKEKYKEEVERFTSRKRLYLAFCSFVDKEIVQ